MPELPVSGPWSEEEYQLLYEVANYWATGVVDPGNQNQMIIEWTATVEEMNENSKKYFISNREYTIEECCDIFQFNFVNNIHGYRNPKRQWTAEEVDLMQEAMIACPRRKGLPPRHAHSLVPDYEGIKLFMNREAFIRGIRRRYYTLTAVEYAYRKETWGVLPKQKQATDDLASLKGAQRADS